MMSAGGLNCWIVFERPVPQSGTASDVESLTWERVSAAWGEFTSSGGLEVMMADQMESRSWWQISLRRRRDLDASMRAIYAGRIFNITNVQNANEKNVEQRLICWEGLGVK